MEFNCVRGGGKTFHPRFCAEIMIFPVRNLMRLSLGSEATRSINEKTLSGYSRVFLSSLPVKCFLLSSFNVATLDAHVKPLEECWRWSSRIVDSWHCSRVGFLYNFIEINFFEEETHKKKAGNAKLKRSGGKVFPNVFPRALSMSHNPRGNKIFSFPQN